MSSSLDGSTPAGIVEMASAYYASATLFAALERGIFERVARLPGATAEALAGAGGDDPHGLRLLLDGCVALGLLVKQGEAYRNGEGAAQTLVPGAPHDLTRAIRYNQDVYPAWGRLAELARTGRPVEPPSLHLGADDARTRRFVLAMHGRALGIGRAVTPLLDLSCARRLLDVGGGPGTYTVLMAQAAPELRCCVLDLPPVAAIANELIDQAGLTSRVSTLPGDYHVTAFPSGQDVVTFFGVLHQEAPEVIRELLRRAHAALKPGGRVYVLDMMTDATRAHPRFAALFAINMALTAEHGWVFADSELASWLAEAGFVDSRCMPAPPPMPHMLMTASKPDK
ncbi:MAG: methyltransferase [Kiritimatiellae bacterium]|nr:methyltransferase [Kiritimatiellia bacterium]